MTVEFFRCPLTYVDAPLREFITFWKLTHRGLWPHGPSALEQSPTFLEAVAMLDQELAELEAEKRRTKKEDA